MAFEKSDEKVDFRITGHTWSATWFVDHDAKNVDWPRIKNKSLYWP